MRSRSRLIRRWIEEGAKWQTHWAFTAPQHPEPPTVKNTAAVRNPIDTVHPGAPRTRGADSRSRSGPANSVAPVNFDLTGLPPKPEEVAAFLNDKSPDAYEKQVDRLLASPHYGERMAMDWLDVARYADTHGYHIDSHRDMWPWRDWVINAFNSQHAFRQVHDPATGGRSVARCRYRRQRSPADSTATT